MADAFKRLLTRLPLKARPGYATPPATERRGRARRRRRQCHIYLRLGLHTDARTAMLALELYVRISIASKDLRLS